jgi:hypothetical protein
MTHDELAQGLLRAVQAQDFEQTADRQLGGRPVQQMPSIDLAVAAFPRRRAPVWANVLFSREHRDGLIAAIDADGGPVRNVHFEKDEQDPRGDSILWQPGADWTAHRPRTLYGDGPNRFVAPYPASLLKVMVAVGVALAVDRGLTGWPSAVGPMITVSSNEATDEMVALLHRLDMIAPLQRRLAECGLPTLRLENTTPVGGWRNASGSGVGSIHMTAWDSARLMWLLDAEAPRASWLAPGTMLVSPASREVLRSHLEAQQLDEILGSSSRVGLPGWVPGLPPRLRFAHKTGTTDNYASDAGIVRGRRPEQRHYVVAVLTNLGRRYAPDPACATTWRLPALGAAIDALIAPWLEAEAEA